MNVNDTLTKIKVSENANFIVHHENSNSKVPLSTQRLLELMNTQITLK